MDVIFPAKSDYNKPPHKVIENLYIGSMLESSNKTKLKELNITHILVCGNFLQIHFPSEFKYKQVKVNDFINENIEKYFDECIE